MIRVQEEAISELLHGAETQMERKEDGGLYFAERLWIPLYGRIRKLIMDEAHRSRYSVHPESDKMYQYLRDLLWWPGMKNDIDVYVRKCLTCLRVKTEHQKPSGLLEQPKVPKWKWECITMDVLRSYQGRAVVMMLYR